MRKLSALGVMVAGLLAWSPSARADEQALAERLERIFQRIDTNKDGKISRDEAQVRPRLAAHFDAIDTDKDGYLTRAELLAFWLAHHHRRD